MFSSLPLMFTRPLHLATGGCGGRSDATVAISVDQRMSPGLGEIRNITDFSKETLVSTNFVEILTVHLIVVFVSSHALEAYLTYRKDGHACRTETATKGCTARHAWRTGIIGRDAPEYSR
ncbi:hypothetical protein Sjap_017312 [Stephania japonica]|uniref:Uncharacterized protein n=1 Tax=Stephania japonica TaxID=461633 RepID=A0AAP0NI56_9MAGN